MVKPHSCPLCCFQQLSLVGLLGFLDSGNVDIVAPDEDRLTGRAAVLSTKGIMPLISGPPPLLL